MKRVLICICILMRLALLSFPAVNANAYSAKSMAVYEPVNKCFLETVNADERLPMASTTKIMTALVALENADLCSEIEIPAQAVGIEGSSMYLVTGEKLTVRELLLGLMLTSGNDAATALAYYVGGGNPDKFVAMMNEKATALGLTDTNFTNPSGLPSDGHYTTAKELAVITAAALENPVFEEIVSMRSAKIRNNGLENGRTLKNHNKLLWMYENATGVKTGFTKSAGRCLVSAAKRDGVTLICVTLHDPDDWQDHIQAFEKAFDRTEYKCLAKCGEVIVKLATPTGESVFATNSKKLDCVVIDGKIPSKKLYCDKFVYPPKTMSEEVGLLCLESSGEIVASCSMRLCSAITLPKNDKSFCQKIIEYIRNLF